MIASLSMEKPVSVAMSMKLGTLIASDVTTKKQKMPSKLLEVARRLLLVIFNKFLMVDNQHVEQTPSANLAVATHELARLPPTLEVLKIQALLKAA